MNLYLCLPPGSSHPPGVLKGTIYGMLFRIFCLTSRPADQRTMVRKFFLRLRRRGFQAAFIRPIFLEGLRRYGRPSAQPESASTEETEPSATPRDTVFLHLPYHPGDPPSSEIQRAFQSCLFQPGPNETPLNQIKNKTGGTLTISRMIVAYHRPKNLRNLLFPRRFDRTEGPPASTYIDG